MIGLMVGFQASVEEVFQVKGGSREAPLGFHIEWIEMNNKLLTDILLIYYWFGQ